MMSLIMNVCLVFVLFNVFWTISKAHTESNKHKFSVLSGSKFVGLNILDINEASNEYHADEVHVNGEKVTPHSVNVQQTDNLTIVYDRDGDIIFINGNGHDLIKTEGDGFVDISNDKQQNARLSGDGLVVDLEADERVKNVVRQADSCGPLDTPRYLNVSITADAAFCNAFNGAILAEERALLYIALVDMAFSKISCLRIRLSAFSVDCNPTTDIYTTQLIGINGTNILYKFKELKKSSSPNGISILLQGNDDGTNTLGAAWVSTACRSDFAFGWVEGSVHLGAQVMAHEIGHLVSLQHASTGIMTTFINTNSEIVYTQESIDQLTTFMNGVLSQCILPIEQPIISPLPTSTPPIIPSSTSTSTPTFIPSLSSKPTFIQSPTSTTTFIPTPTIPVSPIPSVEPEICGDVNDDKLRPGCTRFKKLGNLQVVKDSLPMMNAILKVKQTCDSQMIIQIKVGRRNYYKLKSLTLIYSFEDSIHEETIEKLSLGNSPKSIKMMFNINQLSIPQNSMSCCGMSAILNMNVKADFYYKVKEQGVKRKFWKWSTEALHFGDDYGFNVDCEQGKVNRCQAKKCINNLSR